MCYELQSLVTWNQKLGRMSSSMSERNYTEKKTLVIPSVGISFRAFFVIATGILNSSVIAFYFGISPITDAYFLAQAIPFILLRLLAGASDTLLIPTMILHTNKTVSDQKSFFWGALWGYGGVFILIIALVGYFLSPFLVAISATRDIAIQLSKLFFVYLFFSGFSEILKSGLNAHGKFYISSVSDVIRNISSILGVFLGAQLLGIRSSAYGYLIGAILQMITLMIVADRLKILSFRLKKPHSDVIYIARIAPIVLGSNFWGFLMEGVEKYLAATLGAGMLSALGYTRQLVFSFFGISLKGINTVILPKLSATKKNQRKKQITDIVSDGARFTLLITTLTFLLLSLLSQKIIELVFSNGSFPQDSVIIVRNLVLLFLPSIIFGGLNRVMISSYYVFDKPLIPLFQYIAMFFGNIFLSLVMIPFLDVYGLAISFTVIHIVAYIFSQWRFTKDFGEISTNYSFVYFMGQIFIAMGTGVVVNKGIQVLFFLNRNQGGIRNLVVLVLQGGGIVIAFIVVLFLLKVPEVTIFLNFLNNKVVKE